MTCSYTALLLDSNPPTIEEFIWYCAHAFLPIGRQGGSTETMPLRFEADDEYYREELLKAKKRLAELVALSDEEFEAQTQAQAKNDEAEELAWYEKKLKQQEKFSAMRVQIDAWPAPAKYQPLRAFMLTRLAAAVSEHAVTMNLVKDVQVPHQTREQAIFIEQSRIERTAEKIKLLEESAEKYTVWITELAAIIGNPTNPAKPFKLMG